ncbi:DUF1295-domain-containing protein [Melanomma pulvis-pyrius CBS 109.77]|uniref:DUF1295-domain-containing protein n=1 Tax=Melanomma pulvis-pyrius CBS 109.77 TaxID=1314802 RepID=A0A6A6X1N3_9PLEO|nr:DUF1295-domain-containing protein [Melanomma pulvis-pyrius CBS 109.77]
MLFGTSTLDMALPAIKTLPGSADFSNTVLPYLPQLYTLPQQIFARINDLEALQELYVATNPFITSLAFALALVPVVLVVSEANKNYSQIDRLWSILPALYNSHYTLWAHLNGLPTQRLDHVMAVSVLWGARLTFNYWRKGGYKIGSEDYRWEVVKDYVGPFWMFIFNILFISLAQSLLLCAITAPTYILLLASRLTGDGLSSYDNFFSKFIFLLVLLEFFADHQQWTFHKAKALYQSTAKLPHGYAYTREQLDRGFNTSGLWAYSRHPNFLAEQGVWVALYQWCCCETWTYMNWTFAGAFGYLILFQASTWFTELLSSQKYPEYQVYQKRVGKFLPKMATVGMDKTTVAELKAEEKKPVAKEAKLKGKGKAATKRK